MLQLWQGIFEVLDKVSFIRFRWVCLGCGELVRDEIEPVFSFLLCFWFAGASE
jgi:hypothetical protein